MTLKFFSAAQILERANTQRVDVNCIHVWPFMFEGRDHARVLMRHLLALYCGVEASTLEFVKGEFGKPALATHQSFARHISFNFTHSGARALLAVSDGCALGVDLERVNARKDALSLARRYFHGAELEAVEAAPEGALPETFFRYWTAKEAVIKAQGIGLSAPLDGFCVDFGPSLDTASVTSFDTNRIAEGWWVRCLPCEPGWHAAVAAAGSGWSVLVMEPSVASPTRFELVLPP